MISTYFQMIVDHCKAREKQNNNLTRNRHTAFDMSSRHDSGERLRNIQLSWILNPSSRRILAREDWTGMYSLTLGINKRKFLIKSLRRWKPLKSRRIWGSFEGDEKFRLIRESDCQKGTFDRVDFGGKRKGNRSKGFRVDNWIDGERTCIEREGASVRGRQRKESRRVDFWSREIEVEREWDMGCEWVSWIGVRVRIDGRHWCKFRAFEGLTMAEIDEGELKYKRVVLLSPSSEVKPILVPPSPHLIFYFFFLEVVNGIDVFLHFIFYIYVFLWLLMVPLTFHANDNRDIIQVLVVILSLNLFKNKPWSV